MAKACVLIQIKSDQGGGKRRGGQQFGEGVGVGVA